jgi:tyrosine-protein phosphatase SIW14
MGAMTSKFSRTLAIGIAVAVLCVPARAQEAAKPENSAAEHIFAQKIILVGVSNFGQVTPTLFRGAQPTEDGFSALAKMGVGIVVDLRGDSDNERERVTKLGMQYISIPSQCSHMSDKGIAEFLTILRDHADKKVFVHCRYGVDRTGMMVAAYRISQGWTAEESRREMESFGFSLKHRMVCHGLSSFESNFPSAFANSAAFENLRPAALGEAQNQQASAHTKD